MSQSGIGLSPKPGRSRAIARVAPPEMQQVFEPVPPAAGEPVEEDDRLALADLGVVDRGPRQLDPVQVLAPVDPHPVGGGVRVAVVGGREER